MNAAVNAVGKRYRFTGKERDDESGFYYMGARYYAPWLGRWCACDPINSEWYNFNQGNPQRNTKRDFLELTASTYEYCYDNPVRFTDSHGEQAAPPITKELPETIIKGEKKSTFFSKLKSFGKGVLEGAAITLAVVLVITAVAATGGIGAAVIAPILTEVAAAAGTVALVKTSADVITGKDVLSGKQLSTDERWRLGGTLVGGALVGGGLASKGGANEQFSNNQNETPAPQFSKPSSTEQSQFSTPSSTEQPQFSTSTSTEEPSLSGTTSPKKYDFGDEISPQKQLRHLKGQDVAKGKGYLNSVEDAQEVLDAIHSGKATFLGTSKAGYPVFEYDGVTGTNVNVGQGIEAQPTNIFMVKGVKSVSIVPTTPTWKPGN